MAIERLMFINYASSTITVAVTTYEDVDVYRMRIEGEIEEVVESQTLGGGSSKTWELIVPAGAIWGFGIFNGLSYTNPDPDHLTVLSATGDNPWPTPPPPPPLFESVQDFEARYEDFLMALAGARAASDRAA